MISRFTPLLLPVSPFCTAASLSHFTYNSPQQQRPELENLLQYPEIYDVSRIIAFQNQEILASIKRIEARNRFWDMSSGFTYMKNISLHLHSFPKRPLSEFFPNLKPFLICYMFSLQNMIPAVFSMISQNHIQLIQKVSIAIRLKMYQSILKQIMVSVKSKSIKS